MATAKQYFVDESGCGTLFNRKGQAIIGQAGCSNFFMVGLADCADHNALDLALASLRTALNDDPILRPLRQMDPARNQTACYFHAKDDPIEVRREVFRLLLRHEVRFSAVIKSKWHVLSYVSGRNGVDSTYRYHPNELYDFTLRRLFMQRLHRHESCTVTFARRGNRERSKEFRQALEFARDEFCASRRIDAVTSLEIRPAWPRQAAGLQAVDYFLWALQRVYERPEEQGVDRYLNALWEAGKVSLIIDVDDTRRSPGGVFYTTEKPLQAAAIPRVEEYRIGWPRPPDHTA